MEWETFELESEYPGDEAQEYVLAIQNPTVHFPCIQIIEQFLKLFHVELIEIVHSEFSENILFHFLDIHVP